MRALRFVFVLPLLALPLLACSSDDETDGQEPSSLTSAQQAELQAKVDELQRKVAELEGTIAAAEGEEAALRAELDAAKSALKAAQDKLDSQDFEGVKAELAKAEKALTELQAKWDALPGKVTLEAKFVFGAADLALDTPYELTTGTTVAFSEARYWLSNVKLTAAGGSTFEVPNAYYLVEVMKEQNLSNGAATTQKIPANRRESIVIGDVPSGSYSGITFSVGVDPTHNDNLSLGGGELHVLKNMTADNGWMWFTSYIFSKIKGSFTAGTDEPIAIAWETGTNDNYRTVTKTFAAPVKVGAGVTTKVSFKNDLKTLFVGLDPATTPTIKAAQTAERTTLANNWASSFELVSATGQ